MEYFPKMLLHEPNTALRVLIEQSIKANLKVSFVKCDADCGHVHELHPLDPLGFDTCGSWYR